MAGYILRRFVYMLILLFSVSIAGVIIINLPPGSYLETYIARLATEGTVVPQDFIDGLRRSYGLDDPFYIQYLKWITNFVRGDFGYSFAFLRPVSELIGQRLVLTMILDILTLIITWLMAIPIGIYSATHQYSLADHVFSLLGLAGLSIPGFLLALILMMFALRVLGLPVGGLFSPEFMYAPWSLAKLGDLLMHAWIPLLVVAAGGMAQLIRMMRGNLLDVLNMPYVQAARARGLPEGTVIRKHAVRNAIHPLIMLIGTSLPGIISGSTVVAIVLNLPTTGPLYFNALRQQDIYLSGAFLMFLAIMLVIGNFLADILLAIVDPRIRYD
jgi:peptide/nickel transport system permease protein